MIICYKANRGYSATGNPVPSLFLKKRNVYFIAYKKFYDYLVFDDGRIYSNKKYRFLKPDCFGNYAQKL